MLQTPVYTHKPEPNRHSLLNKQEMDKDKQNFTATFWMGWLAGVITAGFVVAVLKLIGG